LSEDAGGRWHLTPEGKSVMLLPADQILHKAIRAWREWKAAQLVNYESKITTSHAELPRPDVEQSDRSFVLERSQGQALAEIEEYVYGLSPYQFQELVAACHFFTFDGSDLWSI